SPLSLSLSLGWTSAASAVNGERRSADQAIEGLVPVVTDFDWFEPVTWGCDTHHVVRLRKWRGWGVGINLSRDRQPDHATLPVDASGDVVKLVGEQLAYAPR